MEGALVNLIVQVIAGAVGGTGIGKALKDLSLGQTGDAIAGAVGGGIVGQILAAMLAGGGDTAGGMDIAALLRDVIGGGAGGAAMTAIVGAVMKAMRK